MPRVLRTVGGNTNTTTRASFRRVRESPTIPCGSIISSKMERQDSEKGSEMETSEQKVAVLGEDNFRKTVFDRLVPRGDYYIHSIKKVPTIDEVKQMLDIATPLYTALIGGLACGGFRIEEWVSRKLGDLEVRPSGITRVKLHASETKGRVTRYVFLTKEVTKWISDYRESIKDQLYGNSQWLFAGEKGKHLHNSTASQEVKALFETVGCKDSEDGTEVYSCHSFRTFSDSQMAKCGLDRKFIALILTHKSKLAAEASYKDWDEIERQWVEKCEEKMTWFRPTEVIKEVVDPVARQVLAKILRGLRGRRMGKGRNLRRGRVRGRDSESLRG